MENRREMFQMTGPDRRKKLCRVIKNDQLKKFMSMYSRPEGE